MFESIIQKAWVLIGVKNTDGTEKNIKGMVGGILKSFLTLYTAKKAWDFLSNSVSAATQQLQVNAEVRLALQNSWGLEGQALDNITQKMLAYASARQYSVNYTDEEISTASAMLAAYAKSEDELVRLTNVTIDYAAKSKQSLVTASQTIARTLATGQTRAIKAYIGELREGETVTDALERSVGGLAETMYNQGVARAQNLKKAIADITEGFGMGIINCGVFGDIVDETSDQASKAGLSMSEKIATSVKNFIAEVELFEASVIGGIAGFIGDVLDFIGNAVNALKLGVITAFKFIVEKVRDVYVQTIGVLPEQLQKQFEPATQFLIKAAYDLGVAEQNALDEGLSGWGDSLHNFEENYLGTATATYNERINTSLQGIATATEETENNLNNVSRAAGQTTEAIVTAISEAKKIIEKHRGEKVVEALSYENKVTDEFLTNFKAKMLDKEGGFEWNMPAIGEKSGDLLLEGIVTGVNNGKVNFGKMVASIIFDIIQQYIMGSLIPGGGFLSGLVGGLFRGIGHIFGFGGNANPVSPVIVQNITALDAKSFVEYLGGYNVSREMTRVGM